MKTLIFDFDGVLTDSFEVSLETIQKLHTEYELPEISRSDFKTLFCGNLWEEHKSYGLSDKDEEKFKKELLATVHPNYLVDTPKELLSII